MPQTGYPQVCHSVAEYLTQEQEVAVSEQGGHHDLRGGRCIECHAQGLLDPGDEVITPTPCFVEYMFYVDNHGGILKMVPTHPDFTLDLEALEAAITPKTKALIINSPNNPTGQIYSEESLKALGALLTDKSKELGRTIYLLSDEPYRKIVYDGATVPSIFKCYAESIIGTSYSKDISIPGERIGFAAVNPAAAHKDKLMAGMTLDQPHPGVCQCTGPDAAGGRVHAGSECRYRRV